ncbi:MAG: hypothetical protein WC602_03710 [archaeon]
MKVKIISRHRNPVLKRDEIAFEASETKATPSRKDLREKIASETGKEQDLVVVKNISSEYGSMKVAGSANVYEDKKSLELAEAEYMRLRQIGQKKPKKEKKIIVKGKK